MSISGDGIVGRTPIDTSVIMDRVLDQLGQRFARQGLPQGLAGMSPEDLIASAVADWIGRVLLPAPDEPIEVHSLPTRDPEPFLPTYDELLEHNAELAAALGACECWGEEEDCPVCYGEGAAGWVRPDRRLYACYVRPALRRRSPATRRRPAGSGAAPVAQVNGADMRGERHERHVDR
jgi:hypothetical protein